MSASLRPIRLASGKLAEHRHVCAFFNSSDEEHRILKSFIADGIGAGEKAVHIVDPVLRADHLRRLAANGVDVEGTIATGQLEVMGWQDAYLRGDRFEQDAMLALVEEVLQANARTYPLTRLIAHMEWALLGKPRADDLIEYEARANYVLDKYADAVICVYDVTKFSANVIVDVLRTHPMVIIGGALQKNPYYMPPDVFLRQLHRERNPSRLENGDRVN